MSYAGLRIVEESTLVQVVEDWSDVRSPSRAKRRLKRGFRQRIRYRKEPSPKAYKIDGAIIMHPETARKLRSVLDQKDPI